MWFFRFCPNLPSQVKQAQSKMEKVFSLLRGVNPVMGVRVDWNSEEKKGLLSVKGGDKGTNGGATLPRPEGRAAPAGPEGGVAPAGPEGGAAPVGQERAVVPTGPEVGAAPTGLEEGVAPAGLEGVFCSSRARERSYCKSAGWRSFSSRTRCRTCSRNS